MSPGITASFAVNMKISALHLLFVLFVLNLAYIKITTQIYIFNVHIHDGESL